MLDLAHTTNERQLESQGVTKSERKTDTEWYAAVRQKPTTQTMPGEPQRRPAVPVCLSRCVFVLTHTL